MEKTKDVRESTTISSRPSTRSNCVKDLTTISSGPSTSKNKFKRPTHLQVLSPFYKRTK